MQLLLTILFLGLLLQFFLHTRITFGWGIDLKRIWAWKELLICFLVLLVLFRVVSNKKLFHSLLQNKRFVLFFGICVAGIISSFVIHYYVNNLSVHSWILAIKYDYLGYCLLLITWIVGIVYGTGTTDHIIRWYIRVIKRVLCIAIVLRCIVAIKPGTMKLFGFNNYIFEGTVGMQPPAVYYTHINYGLPRSQFLFERPTTYGFWLVAFFPLFFLQFLSHRKRQDTWVWWLLYAINVIITFSRASWGSRIIVVLCCIGLTTQKPLKKLFLRYGIPLLILFLGILLLGWEQIALRGYSNYGHMTMIKEGIAYFLSNPLWGLGGASVGPGSHWNQGLAFNPENQFLQILIEFGIVGFIPWILMWIGLLIIGYFNRGYPWILGFSLGMLSLTISGMVLHSFGDRMIVYPFMIIGGLIFSQMGQKSIGAQFSDTDGSS